MGCVAADIGFDSDGDARAVARVAALAAVIARRTSLAVSGSGLRTDAGEASDGNCRGVGALRAASIPADKSDDRNDMIESPHIPP
jgi:hypothetical protein